MGTFPKHVAIIMDGNGRWAAERKKPRISGHRAGASNVRRLATFCATETPLEYLTLYAFSHENWSRPSREVELLMKLLKIFAVRERSLFMKNNTRLSIIGDWARIPAFARAALEQTIEMTSKNTGLTLQLALSYGGRDEILRALKGICSRVKEGLLKPEDLTEETISMALDTAGQPDPDLVIRTSGEQRISNYLLWQSAYAEYFFSPTFWPDFGPEEFMGAVRDYMGRERRFGKTTHQVAS